MAWYKPLSQFLFPAYVDNHLHSGIYPFLIQDTLPRQAPSCPSLPGFPSTYRFANLYFRLSAGVKTDLCNNITVISIRCLNNFSNLTWPRPYSWYWTLTSPHPMSPASLISFYLCLKIWCPHYLSPFYAPYLVFPYLTSRNPNILSLLYYL